MRSRPFIKLIVLASALAAAPATAQAPAQSPKTAFAAFITKDPSVPAKIRAEFTPDSGADGASCRLVEWVLSPNAKAPSLVLQFAESLKPVCSLPVADLDPSAAAARLGAKNMALDVTADTVTLIARSAKSEPPFACCSLQGPMHRLAGTDLWAIRYRLAELDRAMLTFTEEGARKQDPSLTYRGPHAPPEPRPAPRLKGRLVADQLFSQSLGETRKLWIYIPQGDKPAGGWPVLFIGDGDMVQGDALIIEAMVEAGALPPIAIVGTASGQDGIVEDRSALGIADLRSADYLWDYPGAGNRFAQHMTFLSGELVAFARSKYGVTPDRTKVVIAGFSNGGQLAFEAGVLHPEVFGSAIAMSAGWKPLEAKDLTNPVRARFYASAGLYEDAFMRSTSMSVAALKAAGCDVEFTRYAAGHMADQWDVALAHALPLIFARRG